MLLEVVYIAMGILQVHAVMFCLKHIIGSVVMNYLKVFALDCSFIEMWLVQFWAE